MKRKRPYLLLEVLIAFFLMALCAIPLIYPHAAMLKSEKLFIQEIRLDRAVDLIFGELLEKLYRNTIAWDDIEQKVWKDVDSTFLKEDPDLWKHLPYKGKYQMLISKSIVKEGSNEGRHLLLITLVFTPTNNKKEKEQIFTYHVALKRTTGTGNLTETPQTQTGNEPSLLNKKTEDKTEKKSGKPEKKKK